MTSFNFDDVFEEAEEAGFGPSGDLGPGKYTGIIVSANSGDSQKGDPKLGFLFKAADGSEDDEGNDVSGDTIWLNLTFSKAGGKYAARDAKALGLTSAMLNQDPDEAVETTVGQEWKFQVVASADGEWMNVRLQRLVSGGDEPAAKPKPKARKPKAKAKPVEVAEPDETEADADADSDDPWDI